MKIADLRRDGPDAVVYADHEGRITDVNPAFTKFFGWSREEIVGKPLSAIIPKNLRDAHQLGFSRFLTTNAPTLLNQPLSLKALAKDGRVFAAEHLIVAEKKADRWSFAARIRPEPAR
ncbi:MAG: PAS domain S-box protein [Elusimicrobia bacterium]|nr:PAS domain S-box protein [Elusimicrobiota bacterium]